MRLMSMFAATAVVALMSVSAMAQTATTPAATTTPTAKSTDTMVKPKAMVPAQSEVSKACSAQADAKGLHGKERSKFRSHCKKAGGKA